MSHFGAFTFLFLFAQLLAVFCAPIGFQTAMFRQASPECNANQVLLKNDLNDAAKSMKTIARAFDTPAVETAQTAIMATMENLAAVAGLTRYGRELDENYGSWMMSNASLARTMIDEIYGVPDVETAYEVTSSRWSLEHVIQNVGAVLKTCSP